MEKKINPISLLNNLRIIRGVGYRNVTLSRSSSIKLYPGIKSVEVGLRLVRKKRTKLERLLYKK